MTRLFSTQLPISEGDQRDIADFIQGENIPLDLHPDHENFMRMEGGASSKDYNCLAEGEGGVVPTRNQPAVIFMQSIPLWGSFAPWLGLMAAAHILTIFRTGKHSGSTLTASMVLV